MLKSTLALAAIAAFTLNSQAAQAPTIPKPDGKPADMSKPVQVFILMGQSNMVGMGAISGASVRWGKEFIEPVVSVYPGAYDPKADYDALKPDKTLSL